MALASGALAFPNVPWDSAVALGVTKGKPFNEGVVFINGKYLPPPYVIERWGTGIRINGCKVSGQVIDWSEFLKTQGGVKVTTQTAPAAAPEPSPVELAPEPGSSEDDTDSSLDDLFDDDSSAKKPKAKAKARKSVRKASPVAKSTTSYSLEGSFVPNEASKALLARINAIRTEIDRTLRLGGFVCFGDSYSRVSGDARTTERMMQRLPEIMQRSETKQEFQDAIREANLVFLLDRLCDDLYRNRIDYRLLRDRYQQMESDKELKSALGVSGGLY